MLSCKLWNTDNGGDIRTFQFSNHDYSNAEIFYMSLSPEDNWLAASTSSGVTTVSIVYIAMLYIQYKSAITSPWHVWNTCVKSTKNAMPLVNMQCTHV